MSLKTVKAKYDKAIISAKKRYDAAVKKAEDNYDKERQAEIISGEWY